MKRLRQWFAATIAWLFLLFSVPAIVDLKMSTAAYASFALAAISIVYFRRLGRLGTTTLMVVALCVYALVLAIFDRSVFRDLRAVAADVLLFAGLVLLARQVTSCLRRFEMAVTQVVTAQQKAGTGLLECSPGEMYREVRRCRQFGRPLALMTVRPEVTDLNRFRDPLIEEVQREFVDKYLVGRLAELLSAETSDCDLISECDGYFAVLVPEADREAAEKLRERLHSAAREKLGVPLTIGLSTFPDQDVTLVGLLERAKAAMLATNGKANGRYRRITVSSASS